MLEQFIHIRGAEDALVDNQIDRHFPLVELTDGHALATVKEKGCLGPRVEAKGLGM